MCFAIVSDILKTKHFKQILEVTRLTRQGVETVAFIFKFRVCVKD